MKTLAITVLARVFLFASFPQIPAEHPMFLIKCKSTCKSKRAQRRTPKPSPPRHIQPTSLSFLRGALEPYSTQGVDSIIVSMVAIAESTYADSAVSAVSLSKNLVHSNPSAAAISFAFSGDGRLSPRSYFPIADMSGFTILESSLLDKFALSRASVRHSFKENHILSQQ